MATPCALRLVPPLLVVLYAACHVPMYLRMLYLLCLPLPPLLSASHVAAAGLGHNCEYAEKYLWQFVSQRSGWLAAAQAALQDYDSPKSSSKGQAGGGGGGQVSGSGRAQGRNVQALVRYLLLAESGCEAAAENAAWMLLHGQGASGPRAMGLAAHLLYR
jgi:hypothetical protein